MHPVLSLPFSAAYILARLTTCAPEPPPQFDLQYTPHNPVFHTDEPARQLRQKAPLSANINPAEFPITSGLTLGDIRAASRIEYETLTQGGRYCLWAKKIRITLSYTADVYIAREYRGGSCRFSQTRTHEMRHVNTDLDTIREYLPDVQSRIGDQIENLGVLGPISDPQRADAEKNLLRQVDNHLNGVLSDLERVRGRRQQAIDTPQEYRRLSAACPGEGLPSP